MRELTVCDAKAMAAIHAVCFDRGWPELDMAVHLQKDTCFGAGEPLISFIICRQSADQAEILTIATTPEEQGTGQAKQILSGAMSSLKQQGVRTLFLEVAEDNMPAQALYRRAGFTQMGRRPAYYRRAGGRVAALTFSKDL